MSRTWATYFCSNLTQTEAVGMFFLCLKPNQDKHRFKLKHWLHVTQLLLLLWLQPLYSGYPYVVFSAPCKLRSISLALNREQEEEQDLIYFSSTSSLMAGQSDLNPNIISQYLFEPRLAWLACIVSKEKGWTADNGCALRHRTLC